jgi:hypothetical protein
MGVDKVSAAILQIKNLFLRMHVKLYDDIGGIRQEAVDVFEFNNQRYMRVTPQGYLTLELKFRDESWSRDKSVTIGESNILRVKRGLSKFIGNIYDGGIFKVDSRGRPILIGSEVEKNKVVIPISSSSLIEFEPMIVLDANSISYEGCRLFINNRGNYIDLNIEQLETLHYHVETIDLYSYKMDLLNLYYSSTNNRISEDGVRNIDNVTRTKSAPVFRPGVECYSKEKAKTDKEFFGMEDS